MDGASSVPRPTVSTADLAARITELAGHLNAANRRWLALIAEFDRRKGWADSIVSLAHRTNCDATELIAAHLAHGMTIDSRTAATRWRGERMDYVYAMDVLVQRASTVRRDVSAETG